MEKNKKAGSVGSTTSSRETTNESSSQSDNTVLTVWDATEAFKRVLVDNGAVLDTIKADAGIQRVRHETDKGNSRSFWYNFHTDGIPSGAFGNWKTGLQDTFYFKKDNKPLTSAEKQELAKRYAETKKKREAETLKKYAKARRVAHAIFNRAKPADADHPYLIKKGCSFISKHLRQDSKGSLLVPLWNNNKQLVSIQYITITGSKFFLRGSQLKGSYFLFADKTKPFDPVYICEGISTSATVHHLTGGAPTFSAMNAGNLKAVALMVRAKFPDVKTIIACDNDYKEDGSINVGVTTGIQAARACSGFYSIPTFPDPTMSGDWNDLLMYITQQKAGANNE